MCTTSPDRERKRWSYQSDMSCTMWNPQPAVRRSSANRRDRVPSPDYILLHTSKIQHTRDKNGGPPGRYRPVRCGNPDIGIGEQHHSGRMRFHRIRNPSIHVQLRQARNENGGLSVPARYGNLHLGFVQPAPTGGDKVPSPDHKSLCHLDTQQTAGENGGPPDRYRPHCVKPQPEVDRASATGGGHLGSIRPNPRIRNPPIHLQLQKTRNEKCVPPGRYRPAGYRNPPWIS